MATYPVFSVGEVLTADDMNAVGLWRITSGITATNGTVSDGVVTVNSTVSSVTVSGCFSSDFLNYKIIISQVDFSANGEALRMTLSGVTGSVYKNNIQYAAWGSGAFASAGSATASSGFVLGFGSATDNTNMIIDIMSPQAAKASGCTAVSTSDSYWTTAGGICTSTVQSTGFTLTPDNGTLSGGTIRVYGYRN